MTLDISQVKFEDTYISEEYGTTTLYFIVPKDILEGKYPEAEFATISLEFSNSGFVYCDVNTCCSPTKYVPEEDGYLDYDWFDISLSDEDIGRLLKLAIGGVHQ